MTDPNKREKREHPSYGMLQIHRQTHGEQSLYGSHILHGNSIRLSIHPGIHERNNGMDWYFARALPYIEVSMSQSQFAEAITNTNNGSGTPVTITYREGERVEPDVFRSKRREMDNEFTETLRQLGDRLHALTADAKVKLADKKAPTKADRNAILTQIQTLEREIAANIPWLATMFNEQLDKTTHEAKSEVEAFVLNKIHQLGLTELQKQQQLGVSASFDATGELPSPEEPTP